METVVEHQREHREHPHEPPVERFMHATDRLRFFFGPADRADPEAPVAHRHDDFEQASEEELATFELETDSEGHHYVVRKPADSV